MKIKCLCCAAALFAASVPFTSASTLGWNFTDLNGVFDTGTPLNFTISAITIGNSLGTVAAPISTASGSSGYTGSSGTGNIGNAQRVGVIDTTASTGSGYFEFTVTPSVGYEISITDFDFGVRSTGTGAQAYALRSSSGGYATNILTGTIANTSAWAFKDNSFSATLFAPNEVVVFRLYTFGGAGNPGAGTITTRLDDISMTITASAIPEPSAAAVILGGLALSGVVLRRRRA